MVFLGLHLVLFVPKVISSIKMIVDVVKQKEISDQECVLQIQDKNKKVTERFYHAAWKYFKESYKAVF